MSPEFGFSFGQLTIHSAWLSLGRIYVVNICKTVTYGASIALGQLARRSEVSIAGRKAGTGHGSLGPK